MGKVRLVVAAGATVLLLVPALMMARAWTYVDLLASAAAILTSFLVARYATRWRWVIGIVGSIIVAVPPYPYWLFASEERGWYFHFFHGYRLQEVPFLRFSLVMFAAIALFGAIFWSMNRNAAPYGES